MEIYLTMTLFARMLLVVILLTPVCVTAKGKQFRNKADKAACRHHMPCDQGYMEDHNKRGCCKPCELPCQKGEELVCEGGHCKDHCPLRQTYAKYNSRCKPCEWQGDFKYFNEGVGYKCSQCIACHHYGRKVINECKPDTKGTCGGCIDPGNVIINGFTCEKPQLERRQTTSHIITALSTTVNQDLSEYQAERQVSLETNNKNGTLPFFYLAICCVLVIVLVTVVVVIVYYRYYMKGKKNGRYVATDQRNDISATRFTQLDVNNTHDGVNDEPKFELDSVTNKPAVTGLEIIGASQPLISSPNEDRKQVSMDEF